MWHHALPLYLSEYIERVQKRAFRIILPGFHYKDTLKTLKTIKKICEGGPPFEEPSSV